MTGLLAAIGMLSHCNVDMRCGALSLVFNTPKCHRWHHEERAGCHGAGANVRCSWRCKGGVRRVVQGAARRVPLWAVRVHRVHILLPSPSCGSVAASARSGEAKTCGGPLHD